MQMKATLCVFVALVAVTSAAPAFMRRSACTANAWCGSTACQCAAANDCSTGKYCATGNALSTACTNTAGATVNDADCACGSTTVTAPAAKNVAATTAAGRFCYFSKNTASGAAGTQASVGKCAKRDSVDGITNNAAATCTTFDSLNGCAAGKVCFNTGGKDSCALATCSNVNGATAVTADCGCGTNNAFAASGKFCRVESGVGYVSDTAKCSNTAGATAVTAACTCGFSTPAAAAAGKFCREESGAGFVSDTLKCSNTAGSADVTAACTCGTTTAVQVANGKVCKETSGVGVQHEPLCAGNKADGTTAAGTACSCGTSGTGTTLVATSATQFCRVETNRGYVSAAAKCSNLVGATAVTAACTCGFSTQAAAAVGKFCREESGAGYVSDTAKCSNTAGATAVTGACTCGTATPAAAAAGKFCYEDAAAKGWVSDLKQCHAFNANQADGSTINAQACSCGTLAATTCDFCWRSTATGAGELGKAAFADCANTAGTAPHLLGPQKCKCGNGAVATGEYCVAADNGAIPACTNNDGTVINTAKCACIKAATSTTLAVATVQSAGGLCTAGTASSVTTCGVTDGSTANTPPCTCGTATCTTGQKCTAASNLCADASSPSPSPPAPSPTTITQKITFSGSQASYTGALKTFSEEAYGKAIGIFDTTSGTGAWVTGCSVASVASAQSSAATTASGSLTTTQFATAAAAVKTANNAAYGSITAPTATAIATPSSTTPSVSGASTVTTSTV